MKGQQEIRNLLSVCEKIARAQEHVFLKRLIETTKIIRKNSQNKEIQVQIHQFFLVRKNEKRKAFNTRSNLLNWYKQKLCVNVYVSASVNVPVYVSTVKKHFYENLIDTDFTFSGKSSYKHG